MQVVGVLFYGNPDGAHLFSAAPQLAGSSNLNCKCVIRAIRAQFAESGMLPVLHVQAIPTDTKNKWKHL
eukprot:6011738-Pleurochrysis_carterae.AAC.2